MLKPGDKAPEFTGTDKDGRPVSLADYRGKKLILYFYPKDNTAGCTAEACSLSNGYAELKAAGFEVVGVSPDSGQSHQKFTEKYSLPFTLLADTDKTIANLYGVWQLKKFMGREYMGIVRTTFIIDGNGVIEMVVPKVDTKNSASQILELYNKR